MAERPRLSCIPPGIRGQQSLRLSRGSRLRSGDSESSAKMWESFPARQRTGAPPIDLEPWTDIVEDYDGKGNTGLFMMLPVGSSDGPFEKLPDPTDDEKGASFSSMVATPEGEAPLIISFLPEEGVIRWQYGFFCTDIPWPGELTVLPDRVDSNNSVIVASFNT